VDALAPPRGAAVADVGFGGGVGLPLLLERVGEQGSVHGVEISSEMLGRAARRFERETSESRLSLHKGSMTELPLGNASLDGVITTNTVYFMADLEAAFRELARVLKPSGRAVVGVGDPEAMAKMHVTPYGFRLRPVDEIEAAARGAGLALQADRRVGHGPRAFHLIVFEPAG
jgi:ubiquinone/menaquinone biosynthesis C-methylase UbiE